MGAASKMPKKHKPHLDMFLVQGGKVSIYSRNSENNTSKYPDLAAVLPGQLKEGIQSVVLDAEAVAFDRVTNKILPFQVSLALDFFLAIS